MPRIGNMLWRIGRRLDLARQIAWTREAGFDGVGFHASAGTPGVWRGVEPASCSARRRAHLRAALADFGFVEIHAPFAVELRSDTLAASLTALAPVLAFAQDVGAAVVTIHAQLAGVRPAAWRAEMGELDALCAGAGVVAALEITAGFEAVAAWGLPRVGVNLDVGHMVLPPHRPTLDRFGGFGPLVRALGPKLVHLHLHDVDGTSDHLEIGTGTVDFPALLGALHELDHEPTATLEMQPDRVTPAGMRRSLQTVRALSAATAPPSAHLA